MTQHGLLYLWRQKFLNFELNEMVFLEGFCKWVATKYSFIDFEDALINSVNPSYLI